MPKQTNDQKGSFSGRKPSDPKVPAYAPVGPNARPGKDYPSHGGNAGGGKDNGKFN